MSHLRFDDMRKVFFEDTGAEMGRIVLLSGKDPTTIWETSAKSKKDIQALRAIDSLLKYYSLVEIAVLGGYLNQPLPDQFVEEAQHDLFDTNFKKYYEITVPLLLPRLLLRRLAGSTNTREGDSVRAVALVASFLELVVRMQDDMELQGFLAYFGDGESPMSRRIMHSIESRDVFVRDMFQAPGKRGVVCASLLGMGQFVIFCYELERLLRRTGRKYKRLRDAMWSYWSQLFERGQQSLCARVVNAVQAMLKWDCAPKARREVSEYVLNTTRMLRRLTAPRYGKELVEFDDEGPDAPPAVVSRPLKPYDETPTRLLPEAEGETEEEQEEERSVAVVSNVSQELQPVP